MFQLAQTFNFLNIIHSCRWSVEYLNFCCVKDKCCGVMGRDTVDSGKWVLVFQKDVLPVSLQLKLHPEDGICRMLSKG
jgi:hypothetical protein